MQNGESERLLRAAGRLLQSQSRPCPSADRLAACQEGRLTGEETASIQKHIASCGCCDLLITVLDNAERAYGVFSSHAADSSLVSGAGFRIRWVAFGGYGLAAAILLFAYLGGLDLPSRVRRQPAERSTDPKPSRPVFSMISPKALSLDSAEVSPRGASGRAHATRLDGADTYFLLRFWIPKKSAAFRYETDILDATGSKIVSQAALNACDASGSCVALCDRRSFPPGRYELIVREIGPNSTSTAGPFRFFFQV